MSPAKKRARHPQPRRHPPPLPDGPRPARAEELRAELVAYENTFCSIFSPAPDAWKTHNPGKGHPEQPARYEAVHAALEAAGLLAKAKLVGPRAVSREDLEWAHESRSSTNGSTVAGIGGSPAVNPLVGVC